MPTGTPQPLDYGKPDAEPPRDWYWFVDSWPGALVMLIAFGAMLFFVGSCLLPPGFVSRRPVPVTSQPTARPGTAR